MPSTTGIRRRLSPALLAGAPYRTGDRMAERYVVKDAIGLGPLGYVFRAADEQMGFDVAVKMIHPRFVQTSEEREAFARAVEPARRFMQPSLARVHDLGIEQGWPYLTYSFLDGLTLRRMIDSRLAKGQTFTLEEVEPFLGQLAAALEAAHPLGAHADLKPENVVILPDMLRVVDWGVVRGLPRLPFVQAQKQKSTHRYLAPEVVSGFEADPRADLYSLGVLVGEMLTGLTPDDDIPELRLTAPDLPEAVEGFYRRALNERPEARFRSVRELYEEFVTLLAPSAGPVAIPPGTSPEAAIAHAGRAPEAAEPEGAVEELEPIPDEAVPPVAASPGTIEPPMVAAEPPASPEPDRCRRAASLRGTCPGDAPAHAGGGRARAARLVGDSGGLSRASPPGLGTLALAPEVGRRGRAFRAASAGRPWSRGGGGGDRTRAAGQHRARARAGGQGAGIVREPARRLGGGGGAGGRRPHRGGRRCGGRGGG